jgi:hypothetical protein
MKKFEEANGLLQGLQEKFDEIRGLVAQEENKYKEHKNNFKKGKDELDQMISEMGELEEILKNCSVDVCKYKLAFEEIKKSHIGQVEDMVSNQDFHFFLSFRKDYRKSVIEDHKEIIDKYGYCWWGKFYQKRVPGGDYEKLEPFEESISIDDGSNVASKLKDKVGHRINNGKSVYLYNYCPNPPYISLVVCNVVDFFYGPMKIPYENKIDLHPECSRIPEYYFHKKENCNSCKGIDPQKCKLNFLCNFWFKIDDIVELKDVEKEFLNLTNCFTQDTINYAVPIFYPLLVKQKEMRDCFPEKAVPIICPVELEIEISTAERGHTKIEKVTNFFIDLNKQCGMVFRRVEDRKGGRFPNEYKIQHCENNDEILIVLHSEYSISGNPYRYVIFLHKNTNQSQKIKVENMIKTYLKI